MRYLIAALALLGLSIPLVRLLRTPSSSTSTPDDGSVLFGASDSAELPTALGDAFSAGAALLENYGAAVIADAKKLWSPPASAAPYLDTINNASMQYGLPDGLLARVLYEESHFRQDIITGKVTSSAGAVGIAQFEPDTAARFGVDSLDPQSAIPGAAHYLKVLFDQFGSWAQAVAAYNWGEGNLARKGMAAAPPGTKTYVSNILGDVGLQT